MRRIGDPIISVCMPVFNGAQYIGASIESVLAQTYQNFRLIICDNCSTDDTADIVKKFRDPRLRCIRNEKNLGLVGNQNRCIEVAETKYVTIWHDDDIMMPENLERKVALLENNSHVGLVFSNVERIDESGKPYPYIWHEECESDYIEEGLTIFRKYLQTMHRGALFFIGSVVARKDLMVKAGGFRPDYSPLTCDSALWLRMLLFTHGACLGEPLVKYRQYEGSTTSQYYGIHFLDEHFKVVEEVFSECRDRIPDWKTLKEEVDERFMKEALLRGLRTCSLNDFDMARQCLAWTRRFARTSWWNREYWRLKLRLQLGPRGLKFLRFLKTMEKDIAL